MVGDHPCDDPADARGHGQGEPGDDQTDPLHHGGRANEIDPAHHLIGGQRAGVQGRRKSQERRRARPDCLQACPPCQHRGHAAVQETSVPRRDGRQL